MNTKLADIYIEMGELGNAEEHLNNAIALDQHFLIAFLNLAKVKALVSMTVRYMTDIITNATIVTHILQYVNVKQIQRRHFQT